MTRRCSDDGEPQGTGGVPVLDVIQKEGLVGVCVVVTRYFGGVLLGASGLARAYGHGARIALEAAGKMHMTNCHVLKITVPYPLYGKVATCCLSLKSKRWTAFSVIRSCCSC